MLKRLKKYKFIRTKDEKKITATKNDKTLFFRGKQFKHFYIVYFMKIVYCLILIDLFMRK